MREFRLDRVAGVGDRDNGGEAGGCAVHGGNRDLIAQLYVRDRASLSGGQQHHLGAGETGGRGVGGRVGALTGVGDHGVTGGHNGAGAVAIDSDVHARDGADGDADAAGLDDDAVLTGRFRSLHRDDHGTAAIGLVDTTKNKNKSER